MHVHVAWLGIMYMYMYMDLHPTKHRCYLDKHSVLPRPSAPVLLFDVVTKMIDIWTNSTKATPTCFALKLKSNFVVVYPMLCVCIHVHICGR